MKQSAIKHKGRGRPRLRPKRIVGGKAYSSRKNRRYARRKGICITTQRRHDEHRHGPFGHEICGPRNRVERLIGRLAILTTSDTAQEARSKLSSHVADRRHRPVDQCAYRPRFAPKALCCALSITHIMHYNRDNNGCQGFFWRVLSKSPGRRWHARFASVQRIMATTRQELRDACLRLARPAGPSPRRRELPRRLRWTGPSL